MCAGLDIFFSRSPYGLRGTAICPAFAAFLVHDASILNAREGLAERLAMLVSKLRKLPPGLTSRNCSICFTRLLRWAILNPWTRYLPCFDVESLYLPDEK